MKKRFSRLSGPTASVRAFGKHPAWNDFIDGPRGGGEAGLAALENLFILGPLSTLWRSSAGEPWEERIIQPAKPRELRLAQQAGATFILGVIVPSHDKTHERRAFPLCIAALFHGCEMPEAERRCLPLLSEGARRIRAAQTQEEFRSLLAETQTALEASLGEMGGRAGEEQSIGLELPNEEATQLLSAIGSNFQEFGIGANPGSEGGVRPASRALRLPAEGYAGAASLTRWLLFLRAQLQDDVPLLGIQAAEQLWCDVIAGSPSEESVSVVGKPREEFPPLASFPAALPTTMTAPEMLQQALDGLRLPWTNSGKRTVFGEIPKGYAPRLPGFESAGARASHRLGNLWRRRPSIAKPIAIGAAVALAAAMAVFLWLNAANANRGVQQAKTNVAPIIADPSPVMAVRERGSAISSEEDIPLGLWFGYVNDHDRWLSVLTTNAGAGLASPLLAARVQEILRTNELATMEPLRLLGESDPENRVAPSKARLREKSRTIRAALGARSQLRAFLNEGYPGAVEKQISAITNAALSIAVSNELAVLGQERRNLAELLAASTNLPPKAPAPGGEAARVVQVLASIENAARQTSADLAKWSVARARLGRFENKKISDLAAQVEAAWSGATNLYAAAPVVARDLSAATALLAWADTHWASIETNGLVEATDAPGVANFDAWQQAAAGQLRINISEDPRPELLARLDGKELRQRIDAVAQGLQKGLPAPAGAEKLPARHEALLAQGVELKAVPGIARELAKIQAQAARLSGEWDVLKANATVAWATMFDLEKMMAELAKQRFGEPILDEVWSLYLIPAREKAQRARSDAAELSRVYETCEQFRAALAALKGKGVWPFAAQFQSNRVLAPLESGARAEYAAALWAVFASADTLALLDAPEKLAASPRKKELEGKYAEMISGFVKLDALIREAETERTIPESSAPFRAAAVLFLAATNVSPGLYQSPKFAELRLFADLVASASSQGEGRPAAILFAAARLNENPKMPATAADWELVSRTAARIASLNPTSPEAAREWILKQWRKRPKGIALGEFVNWGESASRAGLTATNWPPGLAVNWALGRIAKAVAANDNVLAQQAQADFRAFALTIDTNRLSAEAQLLLNGSTSVFGGTDWNGLAPKFAGATVSPGPDGGATLRLDDLSISFRLLEPAGLAPVFVAATELASADLLRLAASANRASLVLGGFAEESRQIVTKHGLQRFAAANSRAELYRQPIFALLNVAPVIEAQDVKQFIVRPNDPSGKLPPQLTAASPDFPANFMSPTRAADIARAAGCRLLSPDEWRGIDAICRVSTANLLDQPSVPGVSGLAEALGLRAEDLFHVKPSKASRWPADGEAFFAPVGDARFSSSARLVNWHGNVAEFLQNGPSFWIAGGSFASDPDSLVPQPVKASDMKQGFADVGLRLAFDWVGERPDEKLRRAAASLKPIELE